MNTTIDYTEFAQKVQRDITNAETELRLLRKIIKDIYEICPAATKQPTRKNGPVEVPEALQGLTHGDRILRVMAAEPQKEWTTSDLAAAAHTGTSDTARTTLQRLASQSKVAITDNRTWILRTSPTPLG